MAESAPRIALDVHLISPPPPPPPLPPLSSLLSGRGGPLTLELAPFFPERSSKKIEKPIRPATPPPESPTSGKVICPAGPAPPPQARSVAGNTSRRNGKTSPRVKGRASYLSRVIADKYTWEQKLGQEVMDLVREKSYGGSHWEKDWAWWMAFQNRGFRPNETNCRCPLSRLVGHLEMAKKRLPQTPSTGTPSDLEEDAEPEDPLGREFPTCRKWNEDRNENTRYEKIESFLSKRELQLERKEENKLAKLALEVYNSSHPETKCTLKGSTVGHAFLCPSGVFYHLNFDALPEAGGADSPSIRFFAEFEHPSLSPDPFTHRRIDLTREARAIQCTAVMSERDYAMEYNTWCFDGYGMVHPCGGKYHGSAKCKGEFCLPLGVDGCC